MEPLALERSSATERYRGMQNRRGFLTSTALFSSLASVGLTTTNGFADTLHVLSENELISKMDPSVWTSWGKGNFPNADGATDKNKPGYLQVGFQYHTFNLVPYALVHRNAHFMDGACSIAEYAFAHQNSDGTFQYFESNGTESSGQATNPEALPSSLTLFYYDLGHSLLVLGGDDWYTKSAECAPFRARFDRLRPKMLKSLDWLLSQRALLATDAAASNRTLAHGLAFYFMGKALGRPDAMRAGYEIVSGALDSIRGGVFLEAGGFDSSYQAVNILECEWLALHADGDFRARLWGAIQAGFARERVAVLPTGEAVTAGNTRVSSSGESYFGHRKSVNSVQLLLAFAYYGVMANDANASAMASKIQQFYGLPTS